MNETVRDTSQAAQAEQYRDDIGGSPAKVDTGAGGGEDTIANTSGEDTAGGPAPQTIEGTGAGDTVEGGESTVAGGGEDTTEGTGEGGGAGENGAAV